MKVDPFLVALCLLAITLVVGPFVWACHTSRVQCERAGVALKKKADYSFMYGCFLDGVPRDMIRELP